MRVLWRRLRKGFMNMKKANNELNTRIKYKNMIPSKNCYEIIKSFEGLKLSSYLDGGGVATIGYGSTMYKTGARVKIGQTITIDDAQALLEWEINYKSIVVNSLTLKCRLTQNQFDALVSFTYNVGAGAFSNSTLLKKIKINPNDPAIDIEFNRWNKDNGKTVEGLSKRRKKESNFYFSP